MFRSIVLTWCIFHILNAEDRPRDAVDASKKPASADKFSSFPWTSQTHEKKCLTGYMTDVQNWVDENGNLNLSLDVRYSIDLSSKHDPVSTLQNEMLSSVLKSSSREIKYLSMSKCKMRWVPPVFRLKDQKGRALYTTVEYLTLYGNEFAAVSAAGVAFQESMNASNALQFSDVAIRWPGPTEWTTGLGEVTFQKMRQLDLRKCKIQHLTDDIFLNMPKLEALYLGENEIAFVSTKAFRGLTNLLHLDFSRNFDGEKGVIFENSSVFSGLKKLQSLDLSLTVLKQKNINILKNLRKLTRLSICYSGVSQFPEGLFNELSIRYLDLSGNNGVLSRTKSLSGLENSLQVLYAKEIKLKSFNVFYNFTNLEILDIEGNDVSAVTSLTSKSLPSLQILSLNNNRIAAWFDAIFSYMTQLQFLSLRSNNINMISPTMIRDLQNLSYIGMSSNFFVCNCQSRELFEIAYRNENKTKLHLLMPEFEQNAPFGFHTGFQDFKTIIETRKNLVKECNKRSCETDEDIESEGNYVIIDYEDSLYHCLQVEEARTVPFSRVDTCLQMKKEVDYIELIEESRAKLLALIAIPAVLFPILIFLYVFRRNLKYFCITIRNSATLSLINNSEIIDDGRIFHYDVFVSYCHDDRIWVLDELLPNVEKGCNISVCLHERDFQVGLSILENIVSCMDRSRSILLVISKQFLMSQWCQFEMHLAQHRLLETRREDLILVLLEEIPRNLRPTTLHYLMLTKTYIVWPQKKKEYPAFWKRLSRSILAKRQDSQDNISLA